ncbi:dnaJ homolog subfamily C member 14 isoform X2 [Asparagus officinalis]|uniref:dnaJ homolog subfamily C member 14 isoform X2 n=1 Tax=Asparagus officinalis TaxID=4686 RepID=UPI00098E07A5|nr:dnaJ homolog subfamily C member 14 isoform X2 [Asparagus officinalis]
MYIHLFGHGLSTLDSWYFFCQWFGWIAIYGVLVLYCAWVQHPSLQLFGAASCRLSQWLDLQKLSLSWLVISAVVGLFIGLALGVLILAIFSAISLWLYGSFWTTLLITCVGGSSFAMSHERAALLITTTYSVYCAKCYVGWLGLLLGLNLSFISSDILAYFLKNNINEQGQGSYYSSEQDKQTPTGAGHFYGEPSHSSSSVDSSASRSSAVPSTSGCDAELTSEGEVLRLLNCNDHYSAFGFTRFENVDVSLLKREYRKKAMLVHPDKNMGNEKAAEAFKKLQNAYEVLLDTLKRKTYDDELRREELLNYFRRFQGASSKTGKHNIFGPGSTHFEADDEGNPEESRRIACKNCGNFHKWTRTGRSKSQARWCQDCNDFHQAKDGDGWLEQSASPFLFGLLQKVDAPCAYVCAEGRIYNVTEWFICQGMRCPANTHRASFHVNTNLSSKHNSSNTKGASSSQRGSKPMPNVNIDESMTEEELFDWLQSVTQSGIFETNGGSTSESPTAKNGGSPKGSSSVKKKRKGKKQW